MWLAHFSSLSGQMNEKRNLAETNHQIYQAAYDLTGEFIATTGSDNNIIIWNAGSGIIHRTLAGLKKRPNQVVFSNDGRLLFSAGEDGLISTWDITLLQISATTPGHTGTIKTLAVNPEGTLLVSGGEDKVVRVWSLKDGSLDLVYELKGHKKTITTLDINPEGTILVSGSGDKNLIFWDLRTGGKIGAIAAVQSGWIRCARFSPDGKQICSGGDDNLIRIWDVRELSEIKVLEGHSGWVQTLTYTPSGNHIISGGHDATVRIWNVESGSMAGVSEKLEQIVLSVDANPVKNDFISSCLLSEKLRIWANKFEETPVSQELSTDMELPAKQEVIKDQELSADREDKPALETDTPVAVDIPGDDIPRITIYSPTVKEGRAVHDGTSILIVGKAEGKGGIQTMLVNRQLATLSDAGIFQAEIPLKQGENRVELKAISHKGKLGSSEMMVLCTSKEASGVVSEPNALEKGRYYALIIGIDEYSDDKITDLDYPIRDADILYETLRDQYSFSEEDIIYLKNPTRTDIIIALDKLGQKVTPDDNLLIFYAGHGWWDEKTGIGYWLPHDADRSNTANWFRNSTLRDFIGSIPSRHTLLIADACFSGSIFKSRAGFATPEQGISKLHELPSRKAMTSGTLKEVPDQSVFVKYLIRELKENESRLLPSEALFGNFKTAVLNNSPNVPQYGTIQNVGDEGGDFIFVRN